MIDFSLTEEQEMIVSTVRRFVEEEIYPIIAARCPAEVMVRPLGELGDRLAEVPDDRAGVGYCRSGQRSRTGARRLLQAGRRNVRSMRGGLQDWAGQVDVSMKVV